MEPAGRQEMETPMTKLRQIAFAGIALVALAASGSAYADTYWCQWEWYGNTQFYVCY